MYSKLKTAVAGHLQGKKNFPVRERPLALDNDPLSGYQLPACVVAVVSLFLIETEI
jgi:hypothetical protein